MFSHVFTYSNRITINMALNAGMQCIQRKCRKAFQSFSNKLIKISYGQMPTTCDLPSHCQIIKKSRHLLWGCCWLVLSTQQETVGIYGKFFEKNLQLCPTTSSCGLTSLFAFGKLVLSAHLQSII